MEKKWRWIALVAALTLSVSTQPVCLSEAEKAELSAREKAVAAAVEKASTAQPGSPEAASAAVEVAVAKAELKRIEDEIAAKKREALLAGGKAAGETAFSGVGAAAAQGPLGWVNLLLLAATNGATAWAAVRYGGKKSGSPAEASPQK
jgi:hypothetical protein